MPFVPLRSALRVEPPLTPQGSAVRDNFVGAVLEDISFSIAKHGGQWNALNILFLLFIQRTLHGLSLEDELIFGVE